MSEVNKFLRGLIPWTGFSQIGIPYERRERYAGESKADWITVIRLASVGIISFSNFPLYLGTIIGFIMSFLSFIFMAFEILLFIIYGKEIPGVATIIFIILLSFGLLFLLLGIFGLYIGQILDEVRKRPDYIIREKIGFENE
jgi:dolichol-phosphate mannosyltransferase